jgi:hypothetical protein
MAGEPTFTKESFWAELEKRGEEAVKVDVAMKNYKLDKIQLAQLWLDSKDSAAAAAAIEVQTRIARSAKNAAWAAAGVALLAMIIAIVK